MNRRRLLRLGVGGMGLLAGCQTGSNAPDRSTTTDPAGETPGTTSTGSPTTTPEENPDPLFVSPEGSDAERGTRDTPLRTIQAALDRVRPGGTVHVLPGRYKRPVATARGGTPEAPITITGPRGAVFNADGPFEINHSHVHLTGLTFDGLHTPSAPEDAGSYSESLLQVNETFYESIKSGERPDGPVEESDYLTDVVVKPHAVGNCRADFIKVHWSRNVEVGEFEVIGPAGVKYLYGDASGHNGEVVYVGNPPDAGFPVDATHDVHVHHIDNSAGHPHAELVDVKAGCHDVLVEYCTDAGGAGRYVLDGHDPTDETSMHLGGRNLTLRWNVIENSNGQGVEVGAWGMAHPGDFEEGKGLPYPEELLDHGRANSIYGNRIVDCAGLAVRYPIVYPDDGPPRIAEGYGPDEQARVCGNTVNGDTHGAPGSECGGDVPTTGTVGHLGGDSPWAE